MRKRRASGFPTLFFFPKALLELELVPAVTVAVVVLSEAFPKPSFPSAIVRVESEDGVISTPAPAPLAVVALPDPVEDVL